jgi:hypothetical protein
MSAHHEVRGKAFLLGLMVIIAGVLMYLGGDRAAKRRQKVDQPVSTSPPQGVATKEFQVEVVGARFPSRKNSTKPSGYGIIQVAKR